MWCRFLFCRVPLGGSRLFDMTDRISKFLFSSQCAYSDMQTKSLPGVHVFSRLACFILGALKGAEACGARVAERPAKRNEGDGPRSRKSTRVR